MEKKTHQENLLQLAKQRGFVYQSSEIYGGMSGVYDYGHYGILLKNNIQAAWWKHMVQMRDDVYGLDSAIFMHPTTWLASGHIEGFNDPQLDCRSCNSRFRADHILEEFGVDADKAPIEFINEQLDILKQEGKLICSQCKSKDLTSARIFSMMVKSNLGSPTDKLTEENVTYLRPETCGGIYLEYKNTLDSIHPKLPFGIAQVGKAFRNEIAARQWIFRTREFEQMEMQYFHHKNFTKSLYDSWMNKRMDWYNTYGIPKEKLRFYKHTKLAHYASEAYDIEYSFGYFDGGFKEVEGIHARGDWDLSQHSKFSGVSLDYFDDATQERFIPHIIETSTGLARLFMMFLDNAYTTETLENNDIRTVLKIDPKLAPIKAAILPLVKNKESIVFEAKKIYSTLQEFCFVEYDQTGSVGKRYRKQDEIGTPWCITIDYQTLEDNTVTIRNRDTMEQTRVSINELQGIVLSYSLTL